MSLSRNRNLTLNKAIVHQSIDQTISTRCARATIHLGDGDGGRSRAREGLNSHDLEVEVLVGEAMLGPGVEVVGGRDGSRGALALPDGPVLGEGAGAGDGGLVGARVGALHVGRAVRGDRAELRHAGGAGVEAAVGLGIELLVLCHNQVEGAGIEDDNTVSPNTITHLHNVILGLRVVDPAVDSEVGTAAAGGVGARVGDGSGRTSLPAKTSNDIGAPVPLQGVLSSAEVGLVASGSTVVVLVVVDSTRVTLGDGDGLGGILNGSGDSTKAANQSDEGSSELHVCWAVGKRRS